MWMNGDGVLSATCSFWNGWHRVLLLMLLKLQFAHVHDFISLITHTFRLLSFRLYEYSQQPFQYRQTEQ